ncbi:hypothetical protein JAAARDRAFT_132650 [Jaapia argillacea MUCL 33604]|uniref:Retrotransposon gag domain-containing protein n=1 Tax=Jaapia argillacea MUCL 33604 TaxID=933084 RepID=A0A067PRN6_9AGAM|nr:hypothetical protein JAAARDRAFT_132650 [Jaapia argillacea MUCL 33604]
MANPTMPICGDRTAPVFDGRGEQLRQYFEDLEALFDNCTITADIDKIKYSVKYLKVDDVDWWKSLDEYHVATTAYDAFKKTVYMLYPGVQMERANQRRDLDAIAEKWRNVPITSLETLGNYHREFMMVAKFLIKENKLTMVDVELLFLKGFEDGFQNRMMARFTITHPNAYEDDPFSIKDTFANAQFLLKGLGAQATPTPLVPIIPGFIAPNIPVIPTPAFLADD